MRVMPPLPPDGPVVPAHLPPGSFICGEPTKTTYGYCQKLVIRKGAKCMFHGAVPWTKVGARAAAASLANMVTYTLLLFRDNKPTIPSQSHAYSGGACQVHVAAVDHECMMRCWRHDTPFATRLVWAFANTS